MEYCSQVGVAPSSRTMGVMNAMPPNISRIPNPPARKKAVEST